MKNTISYLRWVGVREYPFTRDFVEEVVTKGGVYSLLPNFRIAAYLMRKQSVIFLAHADSESKSRPCPACVERVQCPECASTEADFEVAACLRCKGLGVIEERTGGWVEVDGARWSYLRYRGLSKNPAHVFWQKEHKIGDVTACHACGGRGIIPLASILGFYIPNAIVAVTSLEDGKLSEIAARRGYSKLSLDELRSERPRKGQVDWRSGLYAVTKVSDEVIDRVCLIAQATGRQASVQGGLALFKEPIAYQSKFFMGLKKWDFPGLEDLGVGVIV